MGDGGIGYFVERGGEDLGCEFYVGSIGLRFLEEVEKINMALLLCGSVFWYYFLRF